MVLVAVRGSFGMGVVFSGARLSIVICNSHFRVVPFFDWLHRAFPVLTK
jgi:hypothetical protein